ncbi:MAG: S-malonyltransferase [Frankiales bacterium]|jgi:[acyl-carrier-protein] S-malonyltransferase|nr:S-malonyltransferase [Frankiales bacterium]
MLLPWLDLPGASDAVDRWSAATGLDLRALGTTGSAEELRDTAVAQPLLVATALLSVAAVPEAPDAVCGHSIGELAAAAVAGVLTDDEAVVLAAERGAAMAEAAALAPTGMSAVLGGDRDQVLAVGAALGLSVATINVAGQVVLAGPQAALEALRHDPPTGARVRPLQVAGAFHTAAMAPAQERVARAVAALTPGTPRCAVVANADGALVRDGREVLDRLVAQLTGPVRFDLCLAALSGATRVVELAPGGTLAAIVKRALPDAEIVTLKAPAVAA